MKNISCLTIKKLWASVAEFSFLIAGFSVPVHSYWVLSSVSSKGAPSLLLLKIKQLYLQIYHLQSKSWPAKGSQNK